MPRSALLTEFPAQVLGGKSQHPAAEVHAGHEHADPCGAERVCVHRFALIATSFVCVLCGAAVTEGL